MVGQERYRIVVLIEGVGRGSQHASAVLFGIAGVVMVGVCGHAAVDGGCGQVQVAFRVDREQKADTQ